MSNYIFSSSSIQGSFASVVSHLKAELFWGCRAGATWHRVVDTSDMSPRDVLPQEAWIPLSGGSDYGVSGRAGILLIAVMPPAALARAKAARLAAKQVQRLILTPYSRSNISVLRVRMCSVVHKACCDIESEPHITNWVMQIHMQRIYMRNDVFL